MHNRNPSELNNDSTDYELLLHRFHLAIESGASFEEVKTIYNEMKLLRATMEVPQ